MGALFKDPGGREKLVALIAGLEEEHAELADQIATAPERDRAARVAALLKNPGKRSFDEGAASPVYKIEQATAKATERIARLAAELLAARDVLAIVAAPEDTTVQARLEEAERLAAEQEAITASKAAERTFPAAAPETAVIGIRRGDPRWRTMTHSSRPADMGP